MSFASSLKSVAAGAHLSADEARAAFDAIFENNVADPDLAAFLLALSGKGETVEELMGAVMAMRDRMIVVKAPKDAMDIVGTGGDAMGTFNISTAVALVVAACGVPVAKHGNRASTSRSGSSDILTALGIGLIADPKALEACLAEANICFLHAPNHHPAMRHVAEVRRSLGIRTIFNLLGPLINPANVTRHLIGVFDLEWLGPMAEVLRQSGSEAAWFVHGQDGMDEITTTNSTDIVELRHQYVRHFALTPDQFGLQRAQLSDLLGGDAPANARALKKLLLGEKGPYRDIVILNAAAALTIAGKAEAMEEGIKLSGDAIDAGSAQRTFEKLIQLSKDARP